MLAVLAGGCAPALELPAGDDEGLESDAHVEHAVEGDRTITTVDATDEDVWVRLDLDARAETDADGPWDLGLQRFRVELDGGSSGSGEVEATIVDGTAFDAVHEAPADGYSTDAPDGDDDDSDPDWVFADWYDYDPQTHVLTPKDRLYVVHTGADGYFKLQILDYYDDAGSAGYLTFQWAPVPAP